MQEHSKNPSDEPRLDEGSPRGNKMGNRGVSRPVHGSDGNSQMPMDQDHRMQMLDMHHQQTLWIYWMIVILGAWTILSPLTFSYHVAVV